MSTQVLTRTEARLWLREPMAVFWVLLFPVLLLGILGSIPGFREPSEDFGGRTVIAVYVPIVIAMAIAFVGLSVLPTTLAVYRERGYLRRLQTTPVGARRILTAQLVVNVAAATAASLLCLALGAVVFNVDLPEQVFGFLLAYTLTLVAILGMGLFIAAVSPTSRVAGGVGNLLFFPLMFFAGLWVPLDVLPDLLRQIGELTPLGAAVQAMSEASVGDWPSTSRLVVLVAWAVGSSALALRLFAWE